MNKTMNVSTAGNDFWLWRSIFLGLLFSILIFLALCGNFLVCIAILVEKKLRKPENLFLVSLAASDVLVAILVMTFAAVNDILGYWVFGDYCTVWLCSDVMCCTASILNLCAISFDRYWHIRHPLRYCITMTRRKILVIIGVVWFISASISFIPFALNLHDIDHRTKVDHVPLEPEKPQCIMELGPIYATASSTVSFFFPCTVMILTYSQLYFTARRHLLIARQQYRCVASLLLITAPQAWRRKSLGTIKANEHNPSTDNKARRTIGVIMGVFICCWLPFFVINIVKSLCQTCIPDYVFQIVTWVGYANSTANPVIYSIFSRDFRRAFQRILFCQSHRVQYWATSNGQSLISMQMASRRSSMNASILRKNSSARVLTDLEDKTVRSAMTPVQDRDKYYGSCIV